MKQRQSNIELLRIIAALAVVTLHYNIPWAIPNSMIGGGNYIFLCITESLAISAVDVFILITGYFSCMTDKRTLGKPISLIFQVILYRLLFYFAQIILHGEPLVIKDIVQRVIPNNYFVILFVALYVVSPYINFILNRLSKAEFLRLLIILGFTFAVWPWLVELIGYSSKTGQIIGLSTITRDGAAEGYNIVNFTYMYLLGAFIRLYRFRIIKERALLIFSISTIATLSLWLLEQQIRPNVVGYMLGYHSPFVILQAVSVFYIFCNMSIQSNIINKMAGAAFTCFLIQGIILGQIRIGHFASGHFIALVLHYSLSLIGIYLLAYFAYSLYNATFGKLFNRLDRFKIPYFENK